MKRWLPALFLVTAAASPLAADLVLILSTAGPTNCEQVISRPGSEVPPGAPPSLPYQAVLAASWTSTQGYSELAIDAEVAGRGHAYLMRAIGPGTTILDEVADIDYVAPPSPASWTNLFTGLFLAPGDYYLALTAPPEDSGRWGVTYDPSLFAAPGVTRGPDYITAWYIPGAVDTAYPPASQFVPPGLYGGYEGFYEYQVFGNPVPEPRTLLLCAAALCGLVWRARKGSHSA